MFWDCFRDTKTIIVYIATYCCQLYNNILYLVVLGGFGRHGETKSPADRWCPTWGRKRGPEIDREERYSRKYIPGSRARKTTARTRGE